ncbi:hypothetical protein [Gordonia sp. MP11Mi]|uniref:Uncharacterized protein n=1 Tax=Gordonia sp. MP11Mi TaxID=3022769 RepID=A0AA97GV98_9ACTN
MNADNSAAAAAWVGAGTGCVALFIAIGCGILSFKSLMFEKDATESARRSAEAAERANALTERALLTGVPTHESIETNVAWVLERGGKNRYVLRNVGSSSAEHVNVAPPDGPIARNFPTDAVVGSQTGVDLLMVPTWGGPIPNQLYVTWGDDNQATVPVPLSD